MDVRYARRLTEELTEAFEAVRKIEENSLNAAHGSSISTSESNLIEAVARGGEHGITISQIAAELSITLASVTVGVNKLVHKGPSSSRKRAPRTGGWSMCKLTREGRQDQRGAPLLSYQSCALHQSGIHRRGAGGPHPRAGEAEQLLPQKQLFLPKKAAHPAEITGAGGTETRYELYHNRDRARRP